MEPSNTLLIDSVRRTLRDHVSPALGDAGAQRFLGLAMSALNELAHREQGGMAARVALRDRVQALVARGEALAAGQAVPGPEAAWPARPAELMPHEEPELSIDKAWQRLAALTPVLLRLRLENGPQAEAIHAFLVEVTRAEAEPKQVAPAMAVATARDEVPYEQQFKALTGYFAKRLGAGPSFAIHEVRQLAGGFSNQTYCLKVGESADAPRQIVVRVSRGISIQWPYTATLDEELPIIELAHASGVPVPRQLWLEMDRSLLGGAFHVMDLVHGSMRGSMMQATGATSDEFIDNIARVLAKAHAMPWENWVDKLPKRIVPRTGLTITDSLDLILERMRDYLAKACVSPSPTMLLLLDWLDRNKLQSKERPVITHGDLGFHNWLFDGDTPAALLDWENVALCSPSKDLANAADCLIPAAQWDHFMHCYTAAGGRPASDGEMRYYAVLRQIQAMICCASAQEKMFVTVDPGNVEFLEIGFTPRAYFYNEAAKGIDDIISRKSN